MIKLLLLLVQLLDRFQNLFKTVVHKLICFGNEFLISDEDRVVGIHMSQSIRQRFLNLSHEVSYTGVQNSNLSIVRCLRNTPFFLFDDIEDSLDHLEV